MNISREVIEAPYDHRDEEVKIEQCRDYLEGM